MKFLKLIEAFKDTVTSAEKLFIKFIEKRKQGAAKTAAASKKKGGYALPSFYHFNAKARPYAECEKHYDDVKYVEKKAEEIYKGLKDWRKMSQKKFQEETGKLEVYGEVYIRKTKPNSLKID
jgi:hypothetical protein